MQKSAIPITPSRNLEIINGALSSFVAASISHPLDVIRITQINSQSNFFNTVKKITLNKNTFKTIYRGYTLNTFAYTGTYGLFFPLNE